MLLANQHLPDRNQTLVGIMSLSKWILGKRKFLSTFRWRLPKKILNSSLVMKYYRTVPYLYLTATNNKEFTGKSLFILWRKQWKKIRLKHYISRTEKWWKAKIAQNNLQVSEEGNYSLSRSRFHSWIDYLKSEPVCCFCNL